MTLRWTRFKRTVPTVVLIGEVEHVRLFAGIDAFIELDDLLRPMLLGTLKLRPLSVLSRDTGEPGGTVQFSFFRL